MHRITWFIGGFIAGIVALLTVQQYHIVRAEEGIHLVPRVTAGYDDIYVDIREFGVSDWSDHESLAMALVKGEKQDLLKDTAVNSVYDSIDSFFSRSRHRNTRDPDAGFQWR